LRIGINLRSLNPGKIGGMEQYVRNLIWFAANKRPDLELYVFLSRFNEKTFQIDCNPNIYKVVLSDTAQICDLYIEIQRLKLDLWFCPLLILEPSYLLIPTVVNIPDIQHEFFPEYFSTDVLTWRRNNFKLSAINADLILTLSEYSKQTIVDKYNIPEKKIYSVYLDSGKEYYINYDQQQIEHIKNKYDLFEEFIFYPANTWPHKNHINLLKAIYYLKQKYSKNINAVFTGSSDKAHPSVVKLIKKLGLTTSIKFLGYIPEEDMPLIYKSASFLVFPSKFEGFGIPIIEAMRMDCAVSCADITSVPEVAGDAALYFDPDNYIDIAEKILQMTDLKLRKELVEKGRERVNLFSWENTAKQTIELLGNLVSKETKKYEPLVSIVTPSYNQGKFIEETIQSVLEQEYKNIEYIVIDGGSTDNTVDILKKYGSKIQWISERDRGQSDAVNKGIKLAKGEIIGWLNSDDTYLPGALTKVVNFFKKYNQIDMVYGEGYHINELGEIIERYPTKPFDYNELAENCFICQPTAFFKAEAFNKAGLLNEELHYCMDYELWMRMAGNCQIAYLPEYLATSRLYPENKTLGKRREVYTEIIRNAKKNYGYVPYMWIYGYVHYLTKANIKSIKFVLLFCYYFIKNNIFNFKYMIKFAKFVLKMILKDNISINKDESIHYEDGWVTAFFKEIVKIEKSKEFHEVYLSGKHWWPYRRALKLQIYLNGKKLNTTKIKKKGDFEIRLKLDKHKFNQDFIELSIKSNSSFCPAFYGNSKDKRILSYILNEVKLK
jgi:glycosyltransferase involved in cell wall biosynthesis